MKNKKYQLAPLLMLTPLLMANSPIPRPSISEYEDISVNVEYLGYESNYKYRLTVSNTGESYALTYRGLYNSTLEYEYGYHLTITNTFLFDNIAIAPGDSEIFNCVSNNEIDFSIGESSWRCEAYNVIDENVTFDNYKVSQYDEDSYKVGFKANNIGDYYYSVIAKIDYDGSIYYIDSGLSSDNKCFYIHTNGDAIDIDKLNIIDATAYRSVGNTYKGGKILEGIIIGFFVIIGIAILLIPAAIIVPVSIVKAKRRKRNKVSN